MILKLCTISNYNMSTLYSVTFCTTSAKFSSSSLCAVAVGGSRVEPQLWVDSLAHTGQQEGCGRNLAQQSRNSGNTLHHLHKIPLISPILAQASVAKENIFLWYSFVIFFYFL